MFESEFKFDRQISHVEKLSFMQSISKRHPRLYFLSPQLLQVVIFYYYSVLFIPFSTSSKCSKSFNKDKKEGAHYTHSCLLTLAAC